MFAQRVTYCEQRDSLESCQECAIRLGRVPAREAEQMRQFVAKTMAYEKNAPAGEWRSRVLAVADGQEASFRDDAQRLTIMVEAAEVLHESGERYFSRMTERRMSQIVGKTDCLDQVLISTEGTRQCPPLIRAGAGFLEG